MLKKGLLLIFTGIIILMLILFITESEKYKVKEINLDNIEDVINEDDYVIVFLGKVTDNIKKRAKSFKKEYRIKTYYIDVERKDFENKLSIMTTTETIFLFVNGSYVASMEESVVDKTYVDFFDKYIYGKILSSERKYKVASNAQEYIDKVNSKNYTVAVIGYEECNYCNLYLPVINKVAGDNNLDIYYFDRDNYDEDEFQKVIDLDFEIPAKCNTKGEVKTMTEGFAKPMTLITKNGKLVDCIKGYVDEDTLKETLEKYNIIKKGKK